MKRKGFYARLQADITGAIAGVIIDNLPKHKLRKKSKNHLNCAVQLAADDIHKMIRHILRK